MKTASAQSRARQRREKSLRGTHHGGTAGTKILTAIEEGIEILRSEGLQSKRLTVRTYTVAPAPQSYQPADVKRVRELLGTSQAVLASFLGVNVNTVRSWEQGKRLPQPIACRFLAEIEADTAYWRQRLGQEPVEPKPRRPNGRA